MAKKTCCDVCDKPILDGNNYGTRNPVFVWEALGSEVSGILKSKVSVTTKVQIEGITDPDLCLLCLKRVVAEA